MLRLRTILKYFDKKLQKLSGDYNREELNELKIINAAGEELNELKIMLQVCWKFQKNKLHVIKRIEMKEEESYET